MPDLFRASPGVASYGRQNGNLHDELD
jgi:hypothetical protein